MIQPPNLRPSTTWMLLACIGWFFAGLWSPSWWAVFEGLLAICFTYAAIICVEILDNTWKEEK